jgi:hypothetical protein
MITDSAGLPGVVVCIVDFHARVDDTAQGNGATRDGLVANCHDLLLASPTSRAAAAASKQDSGARFTMTPALDYTQCFH